MELKKDLVYFGTLLLVPLIFLLHNINENFALVPLSDLFSLLGMYFAITCLISAISLRVFTDRFKAFVFTFITLVFYFLFGVVHDALQSLDYSHSLSRYSRFVPALVVALTVTGFIISKKKNLFTTARFIALYLVLNVVVETGWLLYNIFSGAGNQQDFGDANHRVIRDLQLKTNLRKPSVFWFVFDEYAGSRSLQKLGGFNNPLDSILRARQFFVADSARSNYNFTHYSLTSTLDMAYLSPRFKNHSIVSLKDLVRGERSIFDNNVVRVFEAAGYGINNLTIFPIKNHAWLGIDWFQGTPKSLIDHQTLHGKIAGDIGFNFTNMLAADKHKADAKKASASMQSIDSLYKQLIARTNHGIRRVASTNRPQFSLVHFMLPHEPFIYGPDGSIRYENGLNYTDRKLYLEQVHFTNSIIKNIADSILHHFSGRDVVIIFQGDHGFKFRENEPEYDRESCDILYAVYSSDKNYTGWSNRMSSVNGFRMLFNKYFHTNFQLLPDSSYNLYYR